MAGMSELDTFPERGSCGSSRDLLGGITARSDGKRLKVALHA